MNQNGRGKSETDDLCWYCGEVATSRDHIVPRSQTAIGVHSLTVPACRDCNCAILNDIDIRTDRKRGVFVLGRLSQRLRKTPEPPPWSVDELEEMSRRLRLRIRSKRVTWEALKRRVEYASIRWGGDSDDSGDD